jgi:hypothetical protein
VEEGAVRSVEEQKVSVTVTNNGREDVHQVLAVAESELGFMDGEEFYFGRLPAGESRTWERTLRGVDGQTERVSEVSFKLQDGQGVDLGDRSERLRVAGTKLPAFAFDVQTRDSGEGCEGNGDGKADRSETVCLDVTVRNVGEGDSPEVFARLQNRAGRDLDLQVGAIEFGAVPAGGEATGTLRFELRGEKDTLPVELTLGDNQRYDYNGVMRGGFYDYFVQTKRFEVEVGSATEFSVAPPTIQVTRKPEAILGRSQTVLSGVVEDDKGLEDVIIFHGEDKVFYQGGGDAVRSIPFTVDLNLQEGENLLVVLSRDSEGLTDIQSLNVFFDPEHEAASAE